MLCCPEATARIDRRSRPARSCCSSVDLDSECIPTSGHSDALRASGGGGAGRAAKAQSSTVLTARKPAGANPRLGQRRAGRRARVPDGAGQVLLVGPAPSRAGSASRVAASPIRRLVKGNTQLLFGGMRRLSERSVINIKNKSHAVTADLTVAAGGAAGVIIAQGGHFGGWALYVHDGKPAYCYNLLGVQQFTTYADAVLEPGDHQVRMEFAYDGGGLGKGGNIRLYIDGNAVGEGRVDATQPMIFSADETTDLGNDSATPVSGDYGTESSAFNGRVRWVQIDLGDDADDADHLITPEERYRIAVATQ